MSYQITQYHFPPRQVYLNSKYATLTEDLNTKAHCWFSLVDTIIIPKDYNNLLIEVQDAQIPISFFTINETNNKLTFRYDYDDEIYVNNIIIPIGNYDAISLGVTIEQLINDIIAPSAFNIRITYNQISNKFVFTKRSGAASGFDFYFIGFSGTLFGFSNERLFFSQNNVMTSPFGVDLAGSRFIFIQSGSFNTTNINSKTGTTNQILCKVPITQDYLQIEQYTSNKGFVNKIHNTKSITVIEIRMIDENLNEINFNGVDWSITLNVTILGQPLETLISTAASSQIVGN